MKEKIGQHLIRLELLSFEQAEEILNIQQKETHKKFGDIALELGYISSEELEEILKYNR